MIKNISYLFSLLLLFIIGCSKPEPLTGSTTETALVSITNVNASAKAIDVYIDGTKANQFSAIAANGTVLGTYVGTSAGTHTIEVKDNTTNALYATGNVNVEGAKTYSAFIYDVTTTGSLKLLVLNTDRTFPVSTNANIRFLNLSPGSPALDFTLIRRVGGVAADSSKLFSSVPYLGSTTPDVNALSTFTSIAANIPAGVNGSAAASDYIIRLKLAGTNTVVATSAALTLINTKIYTIYARGVYPGITISNLLHN